MVRWVVQQREMGCGNLSEGSRVCISHAESAFAFCGPLLEPESHRLFDFGMHHAAGSGVEMMPMMMPAFSHK
jgi:hypothetical protein